MRLAYLIVICSILARGYFSRTPKMAKVVSVMNLDNCVDRSKVDNYFTNIETLQYGRVTRVSGDYVINVPIGNNSWQKLNFLKCPNREGKNCEHFIGMKFPNYCAAVTQTNNVATPFYFSSTPPFECPMKKYYRFRNSSLDLKAAGKLLRTAPAAAEFYWGIDITVLHKNPSCAFRRPPNWTESKPYIPIVSATF